MAKLEIYHESFPSYEGVFGLQALRVDLIEYGVMVWLDYSIIQNLDDDLAMNERRFSIFGIQI